MKTKKQTAALSRPEKLIRKNAADIRAYIKSPRFKTDSARMSAVKDKDIDYSDIPELTDDELASLRPAKIQKTVRLDADVLQWLQAKPGPYQTRINALLRALMLRER